MNRKKIRFISLFQAFVLMAMVAHGQSRGLEVVAKQLGGENARAGKQYAVFIAVDAYREWSPLNNPVQDAREIRDVLVSRYFVDEVIELYDDKATKAGMLRLFDSLTETLKAEDSLLIYYAGHGILDQSNTSHWIPVDAGTDRFEQKNWLPHFQVLKSIAKMKARHVVLLSDSCFSGDMLAATRGAEPLFDKEYLKNA